MTHLPCWERVLAFVWKELRTDEISANKLMSMSTGNRMIRHLRLVRNATATGRLSHDTKIKERVNVVNKTMPSSGDWEHW